MANGWKPKRSCKFNPNSVFSLNYDQYAVDELVKEIYKSKRKHQETLVYLGKHHETQAHEEITHSLCIKETLTPIPTHLTDI